MKTAGSSAKYQSVEDDNRHSLNRLAALTDRFPEGQTPTIVPFLSVIRRSRPTPFAPAVLTPSFCVIVRGHKRVHLGEEVFDYTDGDFLSSLIDMPAAGMIVEATASRPYTGLRIDLTTQEIASVIAEAGLKIDWRETKPTVGAFVGKTDGELLELFLKLLRLLDRPQEAGFISKLLKREMLFRLLTGKYRHLFFQRSLFDQTANGVGRVIEWIRRNYASGFIVDELARANGMSVSALHHKFKAITTMSPLQYQKQLRLQEARRLLISGQRDATTAALEVGYESPSQFNREYRRLFGLPPLKDLKAIRQNSAQDLS